jgi:hypothetical protein
MQSPPKGSGRESGYVAKTFSYVARGKRTKKASRGHRKAFWEKHSAMLQKLSTPLQRPGGPIDLSIGGLVIIEER